MKCPRCGGNMPGGVCEDCGFPVIGKRGCGKQYRKLVYRGKVK